MPSTGRQVSGVRATFAVGNAELPAASIALDHHAAHLVGPAEELRRADDVAGGEAMPHAGGRVRLVRGVGLRRHEPEPEHLEAEVGAHALEERDVAATPVAEVEVGADDDEARAEQAHEHLVDEVLGRLLAATLVELEDADHVEEGGADEELELVVEGRELGRCRLRPHHLRRVAVERDADRVEAASVGQLPDELQHLAVAAVHAVVGADGDDAALRDHRGVVADAYDPCLHQVILPHRRRERRRGARRSA